jgi:hypothetical protein
MLDVLGLTPGEFRNIPAEAGSTVRFDQHQVSSIRHRPRNIYLLIFFLLKR